jgi:hypothetical protein
MDGVVGTMVGMVAAAKGLVTFPGLIACTLKNKNTGP